MKVPVYTGVATLDIKINGKDFIMEYYQSNENKGYITLTESCKEDHSDDEHDYNCELETHDFKEIE